MRSAAENREEGEAEEEKLMKSLNGRKRIQKTLNIKIGWLWSYATKIRGWP